MLEEWNLLDKTHLIVRDNAANMRAGLASIDIGHVGCFIHTIQLCIDKALLSQRVVQDMLTKIKSICGHFHHSVQATEKLKEDIPEHRLIQDVSTQ